MKQLLNHTRRVPVDNELVLAAVDLMDQHQLPNERGGAAAMRLEDGSIVTSVAVNTPNDAANLCHETGSICEAHKRNQKVTGTVCVSRDPVTQKVIILPPCGICQERLFFFGPQVEAAIPDEDEDEDDDTQWTSMALGEIQPHHWLLGFSKEHWPELVAQAEQES